MATSPGYTATSTGTDYWVAAYSGDSNNSPVTSGTALEPVSITPYSPSIVTSQQPASAVVGSSIADKATVTGYSPTGTVTFYLYNNSTASGTPLYTSPAETLVSGVATSPGYTATSTGTDYWVAAYSGDSNNSPVTSGTALEPVSITPYSPSIITSQQPTSAVVGSSIADKATVTGYSPTGTVTFTLYNNSTASGTPLYTSPAETPGQWRGDLAGLHGHVHGHGLLGGGLQRRQQQQRGHQRYGPGAGEHHPLHPSIITSQQPASAVVGSSIADKATVTGYNPTGTVTFTLYNNSTASGTPLYHRVRRRRWSVAWRPRRATRPRPPGPTTGSPPTAATATTTRSPAARPCEPVTHHRRYSPSIITSQQPASAVVGQLDCRQGHGQRGLQPDGHGDLQPVQQLDGTGTPLFTDPGGDAVSRRGHLGGLHRHGHRHRLLGGHLQRRQQQQHGHQRHRPRAGEHHRAYSPTINTSQQPASAMVGTSIADKATVSAATTRPGPSPSTCTTTRRPRGTPLYTRPTETLVSGVATSAGYTATATGTDYWVATYNGDSNNSAVTSGTALEPVTITPPQPDDQHQPAAGHRHRRHLDRRPGHGHAAV